MQKNGEFQFGRIYVTFQGHDPLQISGLESYDDTLNEKQC